MGLIRIRRRRRGGWTRSTTIRASARWGEPRAERYITGLFRDFDRIESHGVASRPVPAEFGVQGFIFRYENHFVYWRRRSNGDIGIVTILLERMHQIDREPIDAVPAGKRLGIAKRKFKVPDNYRDPQS